MPCKNKEKMPTFLVLRHKNFCGWHADDTDNPIYADFESNRKDNSMIQLFNDLAHP